MSDYVLKFAWRQHCLEVDIYDNLPEALKNAKYASDYGNEALERIEQIVDGTVVGIYLIDDVRRLVPDEPEESFAPRPYRLEIKVPVKGMANQPQWAEYDRYPDEAAALKAWGPIAEKVGSARVRVSHHKTPSSWPKTVAGGA